MAKKASKTLERCRKCKNYYHSRCEMGLFDMNGGSLSGKTEPPAECGGGDPKRH